MPHPARRSLEALLAALPLAAGVCAWPAQADAPAGTYTVTASEATDVNTGLVWQRASAPSAMTQAGATTYCAELGAGWRLPDVLELASLVDETRMGSTSVPAIDPLFTATAEYYWSATPYAEPTTMNGWRINFANGDTLSTTVSTVARVRCVRTSTP